VKCYIDNFICGSACETSTGTTQPRMPPTSSIFKVDEDTKVMQINAENPAKTMQIGTSLDPK
jgi:hypothetical protein